MRWKTNVLNVWKKDLPVFCKVLSDESELFSEKGRQSEAVYLNQNFVIRTFLGNGFGATLRWTMNVVSVWKEHFSAFCKFLSDEVETIFWESEAKHSKLFGSIFGYRTFLRKWFWTHLELNNECSQGLERVFFSFLQSFEWRSWNHFQEKWVKAYETI